MLHRWQSYSTINSYRSASSSSLYPINNTIIGSHPLIFRLLKGMYNVRTLIPRYSTTWDVTKVTTYLATLFPSDQLSLKNLMLKTVMLCALSSTQCEQTLCALDLKNRRESGTCLSFVITERLKTSKPGKSTKVTFECLRIPDQPQICTKCTVTEYILRTVTYRCTDPNLCVLQLFISYVRPHKPVTADTLARWTKSVLHSSGIDTSVFKAQSVRSASSSHAYARGVPIADILRAADWTNEKPFRNYYLRCEASLTDVACTSGM